MLKVENLTKSFHIASGTLTAVNEVTFTVPDGQFASIVGKSGSGKSTLLSLLGALEKPSRGKIEVAGKNVTSMHDRELIKYRGKEIGFVFQNYNLIPNLTAIENVMLPMEFAKVPLKERKQRAQELLTRVDLSEDEQKRKPGRLSGGQQQRVAIARALANRPHLILADEPTGNLDEATGKMIFDLLHQLAKSENTTIIAVTHDMTIAGKTDVSFRLQDGALTRVG